MPDRTPLIRTTAMPADTNPYGGVFGGWLMRQMGLACGSFASRRSKGKAILVAADELRFPGAMAVGDELSVYVELLRQGRTSLRLKAEAIGRERDGEVETLVAAGEITFVALDEGGRPREIAVSDGMPPLTGAARHPSPARGEGLSRPSPLAGEGQLSRSESRERGRRIGKLRKHAKEMRSQPTEAEDRLWQILRAHRFAGYKFRQQVPIDFYIADFVCFAARLIIELDGSQHAENKPDERRDAYLRSQGFRVLRIWNNELFNNEEGVLEMILSALRAPPLPGATRHPSPARGEGEGVEHA